MGLTPLQSLLYVYLTQHSTSSLGDLERGVGAPRDAVRVALSEMEKKKLVRRRTVDNSTAYSAVDTEVAVDRLLKDLEGKLERTKKQSQQLRLWLATLKPYQETIPYGQSIFKMLAGSSVFSKMLNMTTNAKRVILRIGTPSGLQVNLRLGIFEAERSCAKRGVEIRAIIARDPLLNSVVREYKQIADVRLVEPNDEIPRLVIIDDAVLYFISLPTTSSQKHVALLSANEFVVRGAVHSFEEYWSTLERA